MAVILHIGAPKCGSTALQAALCRNPVLDGPGGRFAYAVITSDGAAAYLLHGEGLRAALAELPVPALATMGRRFDFITAGAAARIAEGLANISASGSDIILSSESWINNPQALRRHFLPLLPERPHCVLYIRPQLEALNAGWWQWGAWSPMQLNGFLSQHGRAVSWWDQIEQFREITGLNPEIRLLPNDITADFTARFGLPALGAARLNRSLPAPILRLMQRHPSVLRPDAHDARIDFMLESLGLSGKPAPWVIGPKSAAELIARFRPGNEALMAELPAPMAERMGKDPRWWDASSFAARGWEPAAPQPPDPAEIDHLAVELCRALLREASPTARPSRLSTRYVARQWRTLAHRLQGWITPRSVMTRSRR